MEKIILQTRINAPIEKVFDLSRDIDFHLISAKKTNETVVGGRISGLMQLGESVTWRAKHLGIYQTLKVKITEFDYPKYFVDEMEKGAFDKMRHKHIFEDDNGSTIMIDIFEFQSPLGFVGKFFNKIYLRNYMTKFLLERNSELKKIAESTHKL